MASEPVNELPFGNHEQDDEPEDRAYYATEDGHDRERKRKLRRAYASVMATGVPILTCWKSHSASGMCMRMQPCEAE